MKNKMVALVLVSTILLTACNSKTETSDSDPQTTAAATIAEATTTVTETTVVYEAEEYANVTYYDENLKETKEAWTSELNFIDATYFKDDNGVYRYPNFPVGKDIMITFKSEKEITFGLIERFPYGEDTRLENLISIIDYEKGETLGKYLTSKDGIYTLIIPANYVEQDNVFDIHLGSKQNDTLVFYVSCLKEATLTTPPTFAIKDHAHVVLTDVKASDFNFINATLNVSHDKHGYYAEYPSFPLNQDIVITFKCEQKLKDISISYIDYENGEYNSNQQKGVSLPKKGLVYSNGAYKLTIPAKYAVSKRRFYVVMSSNGGDSFLGFNFLINE